MYEIYTQLSKLKFIKILENIFDGSDNINNIYFFKSTGPDYNLMLNQWRYVIKTTFEFKNNEVFVLYNNEWNESVVLLDLAKRLNIKIVD